MEESVVIGNAVGSTRCWAIKSFADTLQNARTVLFFPGDCVEGVGSKRVDELSRPQQIIQQLKSKLVEAEAPSEGECLV